MRMEIKNILLVAKSEYRKWLLNPRMAVLLAIFIPLREMVIIPMEGAAAEMGQPLNLFEPCIAAANAGLVMLLLPLAYLVLMSSFPTVGENMAFYIARIGKRSWILGEALFQAMAVATFCFIVIVMMALQTAEVSFLADGWSIPATDYDRMEHSGVKYPMVFLLPPRLYYQMPPYRALLMSYVLLSLFLLLCSMSFLLGCMWGKRLLSFLLVVAQGVLGCGLCQVEHPWMWLFPFSHSMLGLHYQMYLREYVFSPWASMVLLAIALAVLGILCYWKAQRVDLDTIGKGF